MLRNLYKHRELIWNFAKRDLVGKYRGSFLGLFWSFLNPLVMLAIYTFVFSLIFGIKLPADVKTSSFAIFLFSGLIPWIAFSTSLSISANIILGNVNLVKKVVFPLEIFPVSTVLSGIINSLFSFVVLFAGMIFLDSHLPWTALYLPIIILVQFLLTTGICWFIASLGVFVRDLKSVIPLALVALMYMSAIFYPHSLIPKSFQPFMNLNPMYVIISNYRRVLLMDLPPDWLLLGGVAVLGIVVSLMGYLFFINSKNAFVEVI